MGLVRFETIRPFIAMDAAGLPAMKMSDLVPTDLVIKYQDLISRQEPCPEKCTCMEWCKSLPIGCASQPEYGAYLPKYHDIVLSQLSGANKAALQVIDNKNKAGPEGDVNFAASYISAALGVARQWYDQLKATIAQMEDLLFNHEYASRMMLHQINRVYDAIQRTESYYT